MSAATLLDRLDRVRQTGPGRWIARCPAHEDRSPSLSIRELDDGRVLVHDFGFCETGDVLAAIGLTLRDLYPEPLAGSGPGGGYGSSRQRIPAHDVLQAISHDTTIVAMIGAEIAEKKAISRTDWQLFSTAVRRIQLAAAYIGGR